MSGEGSNRLDGNHDPQWLNISLALGMLSGSITGLIVTPFIFDTEAIPYGVIFGAGFGLVFGPAFGTVSRYMAQRMGNDD